MTVVKQRERGREFNISVSDVKSENLCESPSYKYKSKWKRLCRTFYTHTRCRCRFRLFHPPTSSFTHLKCVRWVILLYIWMFVTEENATFPSKRMADKWKRKMNLLYRNDDGDDDDDVEWNKLCSCVCFPSFYVIYRHFICDVISMKHVFIIRFPQLAMHFNHNKCLHIRFNGFSTRLVNFSSLSVQCLSLSLTRERARSRHLCVRDFPLDFNVIEIKQLKHGKKPHWHVYSLLHHDRFTYTRNCVHGRREQKEQKKIVTMLMEKMMKIGRGEPKLRENKLSVT